MTDTATPNRKGTIRCPGCEQPNGVNMARAKDKPTCGKCGRPLPLDRPVAVSDADFEHVVSRA